MPTPDSVRTVVVRAPAALYHDSSIIDTADPARIRVEQRRAAGLLSINGVSLDPIEQTIANGRRLVQDRAEITARAIRASIASR